MALEDWFQGSAEELDTDRTGVPFSADNVREYIRRFRVIAKDKRIGPLGACFCPGIPLPWSFYLIGNGIEYDTQALAVRFEAAQENPDDWPNWIVTVTYSTQMPEGGQPEFPGDPRGPSGAGRPRSQKGSATDPELAPPEVSWDEETIRITLPKDLDGKLYRNTAGVPLVPAPTHEFAYNVLTITRNDPTYDPDVAMEFAMSYNDDTFMKAPAGCAQCMPFRSKLTWRGPVFYHRTTYRIRFTPNVMWDPGIPFTPRRITWQDIESTYLNAGIDELVPKIGLSGGTKRRPIREGGVPISQPVCLSSNGLKIPTDDLISGAAEPVMLSFRVRESKDFKRLFSRGLQQPSVIMGGAEYWKTPEEPLI